MSNLTDKIMCNADGSFEIRRHESKGQFKQFHFTEDNIDVLLPRLSTHTRAAIELARENRESWYSLI